MQAVAQKELLVLGLGNDILSDDSVGLIIAQKLKSLLADLPWVEVRETCEMGLSLLDHIAGFRLLVVVDAVQTRSAPPGFLHEIGLSDLKILPLMSPHFLGIGEIIAVGRKLEVPVPVDVKIFAVEVQDPFTISTDLSQPVADAIPAIADRIQAAVRKMLDRR
jgi:hydrogenase maturation protease